MQDLWVVLDRQGRRASVPFGSLIYEPGNSASGPGRVTPFMFIGSHDAGLWSHGPCRSIWVHEATVRPLGV